MPSNSMSITSPSTSSIADTTFVRKLPKSPEDNPVSGSNCLTICLYNIPRGALTIIVPALVLLITGATTLGIAATDAEFSSLSKQNGWTPLTAPLVVTSVAGAWTVLGIIYWTIMWCKYRPRAPPTPPPYTTRGLADSNHLVTSSLSTTKNGGALLTFDSDRSVEPVELISVYWISPSNEQYFSRDAAKNRWQYPW